MYKLTQNPDLIHRLDNNSFVPNGPNGDWQLYQKWQDDGGTPEPADAIPVAARSANKYDLTVALFNMNLYDDLEAAVEAAGQLPQLKWAATTIVSEDDPLVQALISGLGWSDAIVNEIFDRIRNPSNYSEVA